MTAPKLIFGAGLFTPDNGYKSVEDVKPWLEALLENKDQIAEVNTGVLYQTSQEYLGKLGFGSHFAISTLIPGGAHPAQPATKDAVIAQTDNCLLTLGINQLDVLYIHAPDPRVPLEDTLSGTNELYKQGKFKRFGLANYTAAELEDVIKACTENGFVRPSVYQCSYSAFSRLPETELVPLCRKHGIAIYAYSPLAGGFLAKTSQQFRGQDLHGRWDQNGFLGMVYQWIYNRPLALKKLDRWHEIAKEAGVDSVEMA
jgi:aflatoxin B1 aldehyde reductase